MKISISNLLKSEYFKDSTILAGEKGLERITSSIQTLESIHTIKYLRGGELLLTSGYSFLDDATMQQDLIEGLADCGAAGLCIDLDLFNNAELPLIMKETANRLDFPILLFPKGYFFTDIFEFANNNLYSASTNEFKKIEEVIKEINDMIYKEGLIGMLEGFNCWTGLHAALLFDEELISFPPICIPEELVLDISKWRPKENTKVSLSFIDIYQRQDKEETYEWLAAKIPYPSKNENYIILFKGESEFSKEESTLLTAILPACLIEIKRIRSLSEVRGKYYREILANMLENKLIYAEAKCQINSLGYALSEQGHVVLFHASDEKIESISKEKAVEIKRILQNNFEVAPCWIWVDDRNLMFYLEDVDTLVLESMLSGVDQLYPDSGICVGIGSARPYEQMKKSYQEAEKSLWIGESSKPELRFHHYQDLGIYRLINFEDKEEILKYYYEYIHPLEEHFKDEYFTEMMKTLEKYIECGFSYTEVANRTHIHRNTVKYRIDAIERTCGIDLADHNTRLDIEVITKIYPILGKILDK